MHVVSLRCCRRHRRSLLSYRHHSHRNELHFVFASREKWDSGILSNWEKCVWATAVVFHFRWRRILTPFIVCAPSSKCTKERDTRLICSERNWTAAESCIRENDAFRRWCDGRPKRTDQTREPYILSYKGWKSICTADSMFRLTVRQCYAISEFMEYQIRTHTRCAFDESERGSERTYHEINILIWPKWMNGFVFVSFLFFSFFASISGSQNSIQRVIRDQLMLCFGWWEDGTNDVRVFRLFRFTAEDIIVVQFAFEWCALAFVIVVDFAIVKWLAARTVWRFVNACMRMYVCVCVLPKIKQTGAFCVCA